MAGHGFQLSKHKNDCLDFIGKRCFNWKKSSKPLNSPLPSAEGCTCLSAGKYFILYGLIIVGTEKMEELHIQTSEAILKFIESAHKT